MKRFLYVFSIGLILLLMICGQSFAQTSGTCGSGWINWTIENGDTIRFSPVNPDRYVPTWNRGSCGDNLFKNDPNITKVYIEGPIEVNLQQIFKDYKYVKEMHISNFIVTSPEIEYAFAGCSALETLEMSGWDTSKAKDMYGVFNGCSSLKSLDLSGWNTSSMTRVPYMFDGCSGLESVDLSGWNTSLLEDMDYMFSGCSSLKEIKADSKWNTSKVKYMRGVFDGCSLLTDESLAAMNISNWDTSKATNFMYMFRNCSQITELDLGSWNTANVSDFRFMFSGCSSLKSLDITGWNTTNIGSSTDRKKDVFADCTALDTLTLGQNSVKNNFFTSMPNYNKPWSYIAQGASASDPLDLGTIKENASLFTAYDYNTMAGTWTTDDREKMIVNAEDVEEVYDGNAYGITVNVTKPASGYSVKFSNDGGATYTLTESPKYTNVGEYTVYYQATADNYVPFTGTATVKITNATIEASAEDVVEVYDGNAYGIAVNVTKPASGYSVKFSDDGGATYTLTESPKYTNVGEYTVYYQVTAENYDPFTGTAAVKITNAAIEASAEDVVEVYDGNAYGITVNVTKPASGYSVKFSNDGGATYTLTESPKYTNTGNYTVYYQVTADNYDPFKGTASVKITNAAIEASAQDVEKVYDGNAYGITVTVTKPASGAVVRFSNDSGATYTLTESPKYTNAGNYTVYYQVTADNYDPFKGTASVKITNAAIEASAQDVEKVYDGNAYGITVTVTKPASGADVKFSNDGGSTYTLTESPKYTNAGNYTVYYQVTADNYEPFKGTASVKITNAGIEASAQDVEKVYDGNAYGITVTVTKPASGASVKFSNDGGSTYTLSESPKYTNAGNYTVYYQVTADNYDPFKGTASVKITTAAVTVEADNIQIAYGAPEPKLTWKARGLVHGDDESVLTVSISREPGTDAGTYTITPSGAEVQGNYSVTYKTGTLTIINAPMVAYAEDVDASYDGKPHGITVTVSGPAKYTIMYGTTPGNYDRTESPAITDVSESPLIVYFQVTAENFDPVTGSATVKLTESPAEIIEEPTANDRTYDGTKQPLVDPDGKASGGTLYYALGSDPYTPPAPGAFSLAIPAEAGPGTFYVWCKAAGDENHSDSNPVCVTVRIAAPDSYTVTVTTDGNGSAYASPASGSTGTKVTLTAVPAPGYVFDSWQVISGGVTIAADNTFAIGTSDVSVRAVFVKLPPAVYAVTVTTDGHGFASASPASGSTGTKVTLTAVPAPGYVFDSWQVISGGVSIAADNTFAIGTSDVSVRAVFVKLPPAVYAVTVTTDGHGTASASPASGSTGTKVTLTAVPAPGYVFDSWQVISGGVSIAADNTFAIGTSDVSVRAVFVQRPPVGVYSVTVTTEGHGTASASPASGGTGTKVTLTAMPGSGYHFSGWQVISGGVSIAADNTFIIGNSDVVIRAVFEKDHEPYWPDFFPTDSELPQTGITAPRGSLAGKPAAINYEPVSMELMIPSLNVEADIVTVPHTEEGYPVKYLENKAGLLEGFALPGSGISVIAAHNTLNAEEFGPFAAIGLLNEGDMIFVRKDGELLRFRVYANTLIASDDVDALRGTAASYDNTLTLLTCENERAEGGYASRRVISAVISR